MYRLVLLACLCIAAVAQTSAGNLVLLDTAHASVYLQYDHEAAQRPDHTRKGAIGLWLRIHNNTRGAICIRTHSIYVGSKVAPLTLLSGKHVLGIRDGIEILPFYSVEQEQATGFETLPLPSYGDVSAESWIPSGGTALMSLPKNYLAKDRRIALPFSYEWEPDRDGIAHEAFFYASEISPR